MTYLIYHDNFPILIQTVIKKLLSLSLLESRQKCYFLIYNTNFY